MVRWFKEVDRPHRSTFG